MTNHHDSMISTAKDKASQLSDQLEGLIETGQEKLGAAKGIVVDKAGSMFSSLRTTIKEHPVLAIGVAIGLAAGIGYFAMRLIRR